MRGLIRPEAGGPRPMMQTVVAFEREGERKRGEGEE